MNTLNSILFSLGLICLIVISGCSAELRRDSAYGYAVWSKDVYWGKLKIEGADADSFEICEVDGEKVPWAIDANRVYFRNLVIEGADPASFKAFDKDWACDEQFLFRGRLRNHQISGFIFGTERAMRIDRQNGFDTATLKITHRSRYATLFSDKDHVYVDQSGSLFSSEFLIEHADPETFHKDPATSYWMDKNFVFAFNNKRIGDKVDGMSVFADPKSWRLLPTKKGEDSKYLTDDRFIWRNGRILKDADPNTFRALNLYYATDGNYVWRMGKRLNNIDAKSFHLVNGRPSDKSGLIKPKRN